MWKAGNMSQLHCKENVIDEGRGPRFTLQVLNGGIFLEGCKSKSMGTCSFAPHFGSFNVISINCTIIDLQEESSIQTISKLELKVLDVTLKGIYLNHTVQMKSKAMSTIPICLAPTRFCWLCGDGWARKILPRFWKRTCTLGSIISQYKIINQTQVPQGILWNPWV